MFDEIDDVTREDGFIASDELFELVKETHPEWSESMLKAQTKFRMKEGDANNDGKLSKKEFVDLMIQLADIGEIA